jgi:hypothetical protein
MATAKKLTPQQDFIRRVVTASKIPTAKSTELAQELWEMAPESSKLATASCNRDLSEAEQLRDAELDARVKAIGVQLGLTAYRQDDPRGWTIRVVVPRELADNWDGITTGCG